LARAGLLSLEIALGLVVYWGTALVVRSEEALYLLSSFRAKFTAKNSPEG
jgi:hypothetical protein